MLGFRLDSADPRLGPVAKYCEHNNETLYSMGFRLDSADPRLGPVAKYCEHNNET
jgi:hypothetical protein